MVVVVVGAFFLTIAYIIFWLAVQLSSYLEYLQRVEQGAGFDIGTRIRWALYSSFLWLPLFAYFSIYVLPFVLTLPICAPVIALRLEFSFFVRSIRASLPVRYVEY